MKTRVLTTLAAAALCMAAAPLAAQEPEQPAAALMMPDDESDEDAKMDLQKEALTAYRAVAETLLGVQDAATAAAAADRVRDLLAELDYMSTIQDTKVHRDEQLLEAETETLNMILVEYNRLQHEHFYGNAPLRNALYFCTDFLHKPQATELTAEEKAALAPLTAVLDETVAALRQVTDTESALEQTPVVARLIRDLDALLGADHARVRNTLWSHMESIEPQRKAMIDELARLVPVIGRERDKDQSLIYTLLGRPNSLMDLVTDTDSAVHLLSLCCRSNGSHAEVQALAAMHRAEAAQRHAAYLADHADTCAGGDGSTPEQAVEMLQFTGGKLNIYYDSMQLRAQLRAYLRAVYPQFSRIYSEQLRSADGTRYVACTLFPGQTVTDMQGISHMVVFKVWFKIANAPQE
ncbi:MAG: hypothetical protein Q4F30_03040 [Akkermansia sp.]|nr:hypothetical protein [Akkermansia sp.]